MSFLKHRNIHKFWKKLSHRWLRSSLLSCLWLINAPKGNISWAAPITSIFWMKHAPSPLEKQRSTFSRGGASLRLGPSEFKPETRIHTSRCTVDGWAKKDEGQTRAAMNTVDARMDIQWFVTYNFNNLFTRMDCYKLKLILQKSAKMPT